MDNVDGGGERVDGGDDDADDSRARDATRATTSGRIGDARARSSDGRTLSDLDYFASSRVGGERTMLVPRPWDEGRGVDIGDDDVGARVAASERGGRGASFVVEDALGGAGVIDVLPRDDDGVTRMRIENELEDLYNYILDAEFELVESTLARWKVGDVASGTRDAASRAAEHVRERVALGARLTRRAFEAWAPRARNLSSRSARRIGGVARFVAPGRVAAASVQGASAAATAIRHIQFIPSPIVRVRIVAGRDIRAILTHAASDVLETGRMLVTHLISAPAQPFRLLLRIRPRRKNHKRGRMQDAPARVGESNDAMSSSPTSPRRVLMRDLRDVFEQVGHDFFSPSSLVLTPEDHEEVDDLERVEVNDVTFVPTPQTVNIIVDAHSTSSSSSDDSDGDHLITSARREVHKIHQASRMIESEYEQSAHSSTSFDSNSDDLKLVAPRVLSVDDVTLGAQVLRHWFAACRRAPEEPSARIAREAIEIMAYRALSPAERARHVFALDDDDTIEAKPQPMKRSRFEDQMRQRPTALPTSKNVYSFGEHESPRARKRSISPEMDYSSESSVSETSAIDTVDERKSVTGEVVSAMRAEMQRNEERLESEMRELQEEMKRAKDEQAAAIRLADERVMHMQEELEKPDEVVSAMRAEMQRNEERLESEMRELQEEMKRAKDEQAAAIRLADDRVMHMQEELEKPVTASIEFKALKTELERVKEEQQKSLRLFEERDAKLQQSIEAERANMVVSAQWEELKTELDRVKGEQATILARAQVREIELKQAFEAERRELEQSLRLSFTAERVEFEEQLSKSIALERGGLEEQVHEADTLLGGEIQQLHDELERMKAEQANTLRLTEERGLALRQSLENDATNFVGRLGEREMSIEWDVYELKQELARVRDEQASVLQQSSKREDALRDSFSLERQTLEEEVIRINARAIERIEAMKRESEEVIRTVEKRAEQAERMLQNAETFAHETENKLKMREEALLKLTTTPVATLSPFSSTPGNLRYTPLERARARRRLLHGVPEEHFSVEKIVSEANKLAREIQYSMK